MHRFGCFSHILLLGLGFREAPLSKAPCVFGRCAFGGGVNACQKLKKTTVYRVLPLKYHICRVHLIFCQPYCERKEIRGFIKMKMFSLKQAGRSCAKAQRAFAKKFRLGRKFRPLHTLFCRDVKICRDLRTMKGKLSFTF